MGGGGERDRAGLLLDMLVFLFLYKNLLIVHFGMWMCFIRSQWRRSGSDRLSSNFKQIMLFFMSKNIDMCEVMTMWYWSLLSIVQNAIFKHISTLMLPKCFLQIMTCTLTTITSTWATTLLLTRKSPNRCSLKPDSSYTKKFREMNNIQQPEQKY